jgi:3',5'-cyclic-AMP phosphodiesterase
MTDESVRDQQDHHRDDRHPNEMPRRRFLTCMAWAGTGLVWTIAGGLPASSILGQAAAEKAGAEPPQQGDFRFVQISDTHIGFKGEANSDVLATLQLAIAKINAMQPAPGTAPSPGPLKVPAEQLRRVLGIREVHYIQGKSPLAILDSALV